MNDEAPDIGRYWYFSSDPAELFIEPGYLDGARYIAGPKSGQMLTDRDKQQFVAAAHAGRIVAHHHDGAGGPAFTRPSR